MSSATEMWLSAEKISVPAGRPATTPVECPCRFLGAPKRSGGKGFLGGWGTVGVDIVGTPIGLWDWLFGWLPGHRKFVDAVGEPVVFERDLGEGDRQLQGRDATQQRVEHDLQFGAGQLLADALMAAVAEPQLLGCVTGEVQLIGFRVRRGIPVRRGQVDDDALARADGL